MKLDRRTFLSIGAGAAAGGAVGSLFTPLPWKLTDDLSIWSQNWPWTPDPARGEVTFAPTTCELCPGGCGVSVRKVKDRCVKIEGADGNPVNDGGICPLGSSGLQILYGPTRIKTPLKRAGKRGEGKWKPVTWDEALGEVAAKLSDLRQKKLAHTAAVYVNGGEGTVNNLFLRLATVYGTPNVFVSRTAWDTYADALLHMQGEYAKPAFDLENSDYILSFGCGIIEGWGSPVRMIRVNAQVAEAGSGKTVVQIEPRLSNTAAKAGKWVAIKPGTEAALALGLCHVIIREGLFNDEFVSTFSQNFEDWVDEVHTEHRGFKRAVLEDFPPSAVEKITGVPRAQVAKLAREFAAAKAPVALFGTGKGEEAGTLYGAMAVHALNALMGRINQAGGVFMLPPDADFNWPAPAMDALAQRSLRENRIDGAGTDRFPLASELPSRLGEVLADPKKPYPLHALLVYAADPAFTLPETEKVLAGLSQIDFVVYCGSQMNDTAAMADLVLPDHTCYEKWQDVPTPPGFARRHIGLTRPVVKPLFSTMQAGETAIRIAKAMGGPVAESFPWSDYIQCLEESMGARLADMKENGFWEAEPDKGPWYTAFKTRTRKFDFAPRIISPAFPDTKILLPTYEALTPAGSESGFPLTLIPYENLRLAAQNVGDTPFLVKTLPDSSLMNQESVVEINPATGKAFGLREGGAAILSTPAGETRVRVHFYPGVAKNTVALPKGLGHIGYDDYLAGKGTNVNALVGLLPDPVTGHNAALIARARIVPA
ncbi:MAG: molybdopterin-dependent oxidoreductase [Thermodesulfobacteriota bacterium]